ncbi:MAG: diol dehydratase small subunit [Caldilineaceae bacterium]|nr:diol dehydratase small subunit [Caldilineaceae bacterium]
MTQQSQNGNIPGEKALTYPLMESAAGELTAASGRTLSSVNLDAAAAGLVDADDLQINAATLRAQAELAQQAGYRELAQNLQRAAELTAVPNEELLRMYELMRPGRSNYEELTEMAQRLEMDFDAPITAGFVREAAEVYRNRNLLRRT